ncbi:DUF4395 domain-containing protein [Rhodoferax sp.]|uniref:DUF4395 domain-containing protein n=1 Tax=Rhodoferax sp. TaxID=50421 RepID=UPI002775109F|nr:DUF4395 domain-containing protein [Rhodoferax sp.]
MRTKFFQFGEDVEGYPLRVLNERAVRAAAGLLLMGAIVSFMNAMLLGNFQPTRFFVMVFLLDMTVRVFINPLYAPSMIVGGWMVRHQTPDWVGAPQKRFAWGIGLILGMVMFWTMGINQVVGPINMLVCGGCLVLMFWESAFGICLGCKVYNLFNKEKAQLCPGGVCEVPAAPPKGLGLGKMAVLVAFVGYAVVAGQWVKATRPVGLSSFDEMTTLGDMSVNGANPANAERCQVNSQRSVEDRASLRSGLSRKVSG